MHLERFGLEELLLAAIKSEIEARKVYESVAGRVRNALLKERLRFLAGEEMKHREVLERIYQTKFGSKEIVLPETTSVPLPNIEIKDENEPLSLVIESAMAAEKAAAEYYLALSDMLAEEKLKNMLFILSKMERTHYAILESELENLKKFEEYDTVWDMMHVGP